MDKVDYGTASQELVDSLEGLRLQMNPEKRLLVAKLLARTVRTDGSVEEREVASIIDSAVTAYFRKKYPE